MPASGTPHDALAARVRAAADRLPADERTALALREREGAGYADIAGALGVDASEVPELLVAARMDLRQGVRGAPEPPESTPQCADARRLLVMRQDDEALSPGETAFVREHVDGCEDCRTARRALREASLACRSWDAGPAVAAIAEPETPPAPAPVIAPPPVLAPDPEPLPVPAPLPRRRPLPPPRRTASARRRRGLEVLVAGALAACIAAVVGVALGGGESSQAGDVRPVSTSVPDATAAPVEEDRADARDEEAARERRAAARRRAEERRRAAARRRAKERRRAAAAETPAPTATTAPTATATPERKRSTPRRTPTPTPEPRRTATPQPTSSPPPRRTPAPTATPVPVNPDGDVVPPPGDTFCPEGRQDCE